MANKAADQEERRFQNKLQKAVTMRIVALVLISAVCFVAGQFAAIWISNESNAQKHLTQLEESFVFFDTQSREFLQDPATEDVVKKLLESQDVQAVEQLKLIFWKFEERCGISSEILITDDEGNVMYTSFGEARLSSYLINYNNAICFNAKNTKKDEVYRAVYYEQGDYADTIYVNLIRQGEDIQGYISIFLSGSAWNFYLSESNFDGVITDMRDNAMYVSKPGLLDGYNKYRGGDGGVWKSANGRYWVVSRTLPEMSAVIYSLVYYPPNKGIWVGFVILLSMGIAWYGIATWISRTMADKNAASIEKLVGEIRIIGKGDYRHRIQMDTDDEYAEVGHQINVMLSNIMELNERNTELIRLNSRIEMEQLAAQMNPHFLYNTLEIIRNLVIFDASKSEEIIMNLTEILRYSVDSTKQEVLLEDDMKYIYFYLNIQNCRFGDRFHCDIDLSPECMRWHVPKLLLQPLIENSIKHGFRRKMELNIRIFGKVENHVLCIHVADDGQGMTDSEAKTLEQQLGTRDSASASLGLRNLSRRLYLRYGDRSGLRIRNMEGIGFEVIVNIEQAGDETICTKL